MKPKHVLFFFLITIPAAGLATVATFAWQNLRGAGPAVLPPPVVEPVPTTPTNSTGLPLSLPDGLSVSFLAQDLPGARVIAQGPDGHFYVSQTKEGKITRLRFGKDWVEVGRDVFASDLKNPHGLAFDWQEPGMLYVATEDAILRYDTTAPAPTPTKILDLPAGGRHFTRTIKIGPDERLYVSIGSSCDVCVEKDPQYASLWSLKKDGTDFKQVAKGLRNSVFFAWEELNGELWATEMGRDRLGDDLPPDEINVIPTDRAEVVNFGWPTCYGQNVHDTEFDKNTYVRNPCLEPFETPAKVDLPAHVAPLGIAFVPEEGWPEDWWYDAVVAYHGSWNRTEPVGYKLARITRNAQGEVESQEDFVTGWLADDGALGRPVDVLIQPGGTMFVTDDKAGVVYRFAYTGPRPGDGTEGFSQGPLHLNGFNAGDVLTPGTTLVGQARGNMFFEASFPVRVLDADGTELGLGLATAQGEWMTSDFVPFTVQLDFKPPTGELGLLRFERDNASGLPEFDLNVDVPVRFK